MGKIIFLILAIVIFNGCQMREKEKPAIKIGEIEVTSEEFDNAFKSSSLAEPGAASAARREFLETFISRKLILKEAERMGLDKDPQFLQSVQFFWEQSLLKLVLSKKMKEISVNIKVEDKQISDYYENNKEQIYVDKELSEVYDQIKWLLFREKQNKAIQDWASSLRNKTKIQIEYELLGIEQDR